MRKKEKCRRGIEKVGTLTWGPGLYFFFFYWLSLTQACLKRERERNMVKLYSCPKKQSEVAVILTSHEKLQGPQFRH